MALQIKKVETMDGYTVALCDQNGKPLPGQMSLQIISQPDDIVRAIVEFAIGADVILVNGDREFMHCRPDSEQIPR